MGDKAIDDLRELGGNDEGMRDILPGGSDFKHLLIESTHAYCPICASKCSSLHPVPRRFVPDMINPFCGGNTKFDIIGNQGPLWNRVYNGKRGNVIGNDKSEIVIEVPQQLVHARRELDGVLAYFQQSAEVPARMVTGHNIQQNDRRVPAITAYQPAAPKSKDKTQSEFNQMKDLVALNNDRPLEKERLELFMATIGAKSLKKAWATKNIENAKDWLLLGVDVGNSIFFREWTHKEKGEKDHHHMKLDDTAYGFTGDAALVRSDGGWQNLEQFRLNGE